MDKKSRGFTLLELLVTMAVLAILVSVVYPTYTAFGNRSQRSIAKTELARIAQLEEMFFIDNRTYGTLSQLGFANDTVGLNNNGDPVVTNAGVYNVVITPAPSAAGFIAQATATGGQTDDTGCTTMTISSTGVKTPAACW